MDKGGKMRQRGILKIGKLSFVILLGLIGVLLYTSQPSLAQEEDDGILGKSKRYLVLTIGIEQEEKLPALPDNVDFKGTFKKITKAEYSKEQGTVRFNPTTEGNATFTIHDKNKNGKMVVEYILVVKKSKLDAVVREMQSLLGDIEGINIKVVNNKVLVDGQILLPRDMNRIHSVVKQFGDQAASLVTISPVAQKKIAEFISRDINNPEIEVRAVNDKFILQGVANSEDEKVRAEIIAKTYLPPVVQESAVADGVMKTPKAANDGIINLITVKPSAPAPPAKIIQLVVHYVELKKDYSKGFRFQFTPAIGDGTKLDFGTSDRAPGSVTSVLAGTINNLIPKLNWSKEHGHARVLESSSMIVQEGKVGTINSYTEIPYKISTKDGPATNFKQVGMGSKVTPAIIGDRSDTINMDIEFKIDALTGITADGPLTTTNNINTSITVRSGQSAAIGGLIRNQSSTGYNRPTKDYPANPIISLYASKDFTHNQSQFVVFITPIIKSSASAGSEKVKEKFRLRD